MEKWSASAFRGERLERPGDWGVCFSADWCPFCRDFLVRFETLDGATPFPLAIGDLTDLESPLWDDFHIEVVPTLIAFRDGKVVWRRDGVYGAGLNEKDLADLRAAFQP